MAGLTLLLFSKDLTGVLAGYSESWGSRGAMSRAVPSFRVKSGLKPVVDPFRVETRMRHLPRWE